MSSEPSSCRLFVILARKAHRAVIFRRGPYMWTQIILWDTATDTFTEGQWFKGTIYTRRCDVSPDGSKLLYFGAKHYKRYHQNAVIKNNWTAISRPPYLTALVMWDTSDTRGGGGHFADNHTVYLNLTDFGIAKASKLLPEGFEVRSPAPGHAFGNEDGVYYNVLLQSRGWKSLKNDPQVNKDHEVWRKDASDHSHSLFMTIVSGYGNTTVSTYTLIRHQDHAAFEIDSREWADWDKRGRLVYTDKGKLFMGIIRADRIEPIQLADFSSNKLKKILSPTWARTWDQT